MSPTFITLGVYVLYVMAPQTTTSDGIGQWNQAENIRVGEAVEDGNATPEVVGIDDLILLEYDDGETIRLQGNLFQRHTQTGALRVV